MSTWKIIDGASYEAPQGKDSSIHSHHCWEWVYYRSGSIECLHGDERLSMQPGHFWLTPPRVRHAEIAKTRYTNFWLHVQGQPDASLPRVVKDNAEGSIGRLCRLLMTELHNRFPYRDAMMALHTEALLWHLRRCQEEGQRDLKSTVVRDAEALWEDQPILSVAQMAEHMGVSLSGLRQAFHRERGQSPVVSRTLSRINRAVRFLKSSNLKLTAVAERCGFESSSHLSRHIKAATGKSPGQLRK